MKAFKFLFVLFLALNIISCSNSNDNEPIIILSKANLIGTYGIESMVIDTKTTTTVSGFPVVVNSSSIGSLFQVDLIFNSDNTYSIKGEHAIKTTITSVGNAPIINEEIIVLNESGTYSVNTVDSSILFTNQNAEFLTGKITVSGISENKLSLTQLATENIPATNSIVEANLNVSFIKK